MTRYVIVGNGAAGVAAAEEIRSLDPSAVLTLIGGERHPMYSRPGLAYVVINEIPDRQVIARQPEWYREHAIELVHATATRLDVEARLVRLCAAGQALGWPGARLRPSADRHGRAGCAAPVPGA